MVKTSTYDFRSFCHGELVEINKNSPKTLFKDSLKVSSNKKGVVLNSVSGMLVAYSQVYPYALPVAGGSIQSAFDPVIVMLQNMAYPVAFICIAWACLEAMIGKPASAVSRAKWAIIGYLAMRYVPALLKSL